jgi:hypothetical protein
MTAHSPSLSRRAALAFGAAALATPQVGRAQAPGLLLTGGPIYTGQGDGQTVEAVAIQGGRIAFAGALAEAKAAAP